ncbi:DUF4124 domain-containing protein [Ferrimonas senticii]|uniref:DUF4124 domain-containing protein n=1 Tax=Ferrimonas senticii TaxID=394566 RepID=UPI0004192EF6|nr:DUF4124 domain-containing protein [Ferrimonas senticii]
MNNLTRNLLIALLALTSAPLSAAIYRCDDQGDSHYQDKPCNQLDKSQGKVNLKPGSTLGNLPSAPRAASTYPTTPNPSRTISFSQDIAAYEADCFKQGDNTVYSVMISNYSPTHRYRVNVSSQFFIKNKGTRSFIEWDKQRQLLVLKPGDSRRVKLSSRLHGADVRSRCEGNASWQQLN